MGMVTLLAAAALIPAQAFDFKNALHATPQIAAGRRPVHIDPIESAIVTGTFTKPTAGADWRAVSANDQGSFAGSGYFYAEYSSPTDGVMLLQAEGNSLVYVNGVIRPGDVYGFGYLRLPVTIKAGTNSFLFQSSRGGINAKLLPIDKPLFFDIGDLTLPDFVLGDRNAVNAAIVVTNAGARRDGLTLVATVDGAIRKTWLPAMQAMSIRKVGFTIPPPTRLDEDTVDCNVRLMSGETVIDEKTLTLRLRADTQTHKRTFISGIDGSVQYYGVNPATPLPNDHDRPALVLTLHGASVEAIGQAEAYASKTWAHIIAPTNRRPYGFDWEDWGRLDAMEVLTDAQKRYRTDPSRTYLTGHSMGGHGAWQVGAHFPDKFAGVAPSAGWATFWSYVGGGKKPMDDADPMQEILSRALNPSDTLALAGNLEPLPVYILHGDADDNVPVSEARLMATELTKFHHSWTLFEKKDAGHWWDDSDEPGASCVDWPAIFDMFAASRISEEAATRHIRFVTMNPENSATMRWASIIAQQRQMAPSSIDLLFDPHLRRFSGKTQNVARMALSVRHLEGGKPISINVDGTSIPDIRWPLGDSLLLEKSENGWKVVEGFPPNDKSPGRSSGFKNGFDREMVFVYGTRGNAEENAWAANRARFDAESYYYRGNGSVDVMPDSAFGSTISVDRSVILYGNEATNSAWKDLLAGSPIKVSRNSLVVGTSARKGSDFAVLFTRPRPGSLVASVSAVSGTGIVGMRLTERLNYFVAGVAFPDFFIVGPEMLQSGYNGVRAAGFFETDWSLGSDYRLR